MSETVGWAFEERDSSKRIFALDAVRGIAAFVVVLYHFRLAFETNAVPWYLRLLFSGRQAVVLFFVLSGYVLSLPYWRGRALPYGAYLVRRGFRIYVPYVAAVLLAVVGAWEFSNAQLPLTPRFYGTWHTPLTAGLVVRQLLMGTGGELNTAFWSLRYEVQMSIVFPLLCWWMVRLRLRGAAMFALFAAGMGVGLRSASVAWGACFLLGAVLAGGREWIGKPYRTPTWAKVLVLGAVVVGYCSESMGGMIFGACGVVVFAVESGAREWLETAGPMYLGRISYSMYLMHGTVLQAMLVMLYGRMPVWVFAGLFLAVTLVVSHLFCVYVEEPATRLGRRLTRRQKVVRGEFVQGQVAA